MQSESQCQKLKIEFPWEQVPLGGGFFVPTLNPERTIEQAYRSATERHIFHIKPFVCIVNGQLGVYFQRQRLSFSSQIRSEHP
jgi:hypothetical protein